MFVDCNTSSINDSSNPLLARVNSCWGMPLLGRCKMRSEWSADAATEQPQFVEATARDCYCTVHGASTAGVILLSQLWAQLGIRPQIACVILQPLWPHVQNSIATCIGHVTIAGSNKRVNVLLSLKAWQQSNRSVVANAVTNSCQSQSAWCRFNPSAGPCQRDRRVLKYLRLIFPAAQVSGFGHSGRCTLPTGHRMLVWSRNPA